MMKFNPPRPEILDHAAALVVSASKTAFADNLECVILKGSAVKGDFIQGYSDLDFDVFLKPEAMDSERVPKIKGAIRFQKAFGSVNPEDFNGKFQIYFINSEKYPPDWVPSVAETCKICWGNLPSCAEELDDLTYLQHAKQFLLNAEHDKQSHVNRFVDKPNGEVPAVIRLLGATIKAYMYSISMLLTSKPKFVLGLKLDRLIAIVEEGINSEGHFSKFFECVSNWSLIRQDCDYARDAFREGIEALDEIICWNKKSI